MYALSSLHQIPYTVVPPGLCLRCSLCIQACRFSHPGLSFVFSHSFYGIAQGGAGHCGMVFLEKGTQYGDVFLASLAQHPAHSFVYEVMVVEKQLFGIAQHMPEVTVAYGRKRGDHGNALFPQIAA